MKAVLIATTLAALASTSLPGQAANVDVGVSIGISQPGVYGRIDIGRFPQPQVVVQQPVYVSPPAVYVERPAPIYIYAPPGHQRDWNRHCGAYRACGVPVYFVQERWYRDNVMAHRYDRRDDRRDDRRYDRRDDHRDDRGEQGHRGEGRGNGHGREH